jgi:preprotein translocase subunit SecG
MIAVVQVILWILLIVSIFLLIGVILLQEGKGGGLAEAFGGVGAETFGVKAAGINKFTSIVGAVFLALCISLTLFKPGPSNVPALKDPGAFPNFGGQNTPVVPPVVPPGGNKSSPPGSTPPGGGKSAPPGSTPPGNDKPPAPPDNGKPPPPDDGKPPK